MKPTLVITQDTRRAKETGKYPIKLRLTFLRQQKYYPIGLDLTIDEFALVQNVGNIDKKTPAPLKRQAKEWRLTCDTIQVKATNLISKMDDFTFRTFEKRFFQNNQSAMDVYLFYDNTIKRLKESGKVGTASNYECSRNSIKAFCPKLTFRDISVDFLNEYERWLLSNGRSISTVGIYLRPLRAIVNEAISEGLISKEYHYHFGKRQYQIPSANNIKKALTLQEIELIFQYNAVKESWAEKARDFFIFSYLGNGMNMKDIALLRIKDIDGDFIRFTRAKTQDTSRKGIRLISIHLSDDLKRIIDRWRNTDTDPEGYLFPILPSLCIEEKKRKIIQQFTKMMNKYLNLVAGDLGISKHITTYFARHSFATVLKRSGSSIEVISESLGHSNHKTTMSYLDSFEDETKKELQSKLIDFGKDRQLSSTSPRG